MQHLRGAGPWAPSRSWGGGPCPRRAPPSLLHHRPPPSPQGSQEPLAESPLPRGPRGDAAAGEGGRARLGASSGSVSERRPAATQRPCDPAAPRREAAGGVSSHSHGLPRKRRDPPSPRSPVRAPRTREGCLRKLWAPTSTRRGLCKVPPACRVAAMRTEAGGAHPVSPTCTLTDLQPEPGVLGLSPAAPAHGQHQAPAGRATALKHGTRTRPPPLPAPRHLGTAEQGGPGGQRDLPGLGAGSPAHCAGAPFSDLGPCPAAPRCAPARGRGSRSARSRQACGLAAGDAQAPGTRWAPPCCPRSERANRLLRCFSPSEERRHAGSGGRAGLGPPPPGPQRAPPRPSPSPGRVPRGRGQ